MDCPVCGADALVVECPADLRGFRPDEPDTLGVCRCCLTTAPAGDESVEADLADVGDFSTALPSDSETALAITLLVTLCDSLAVYRSEIEELVGRIERAGVDPLSTLDRLAADPALDLVIDVERRRPQLVQLLR